MSLKIITQKLEFEIIGNINELHINLHFGIFPNC